MSSTKLFSTALQTDTTSDSNGQPPLRPPLLPAFLITGLLLAAIVCIIVWRHMIERRLQREEDNAAWQAAIRDGESRARHRNLQRPVLWEPHFSNEHMLAKWANIMPLSVTPLRRRGKPKTGLSRYLTPPDRPLSFFTRIFGHERREQPPQPSQPPPIYLLMQSQGPASRSFFMRMIGRERRQPSQSLAPLPPPTDTQSPSRPAPRSLLVRMIGREQRIPLPQLAPLPVLAETQRPLEPLANEEEAEHDPIDQLQVVVLIELPHPNRRRRSSYLPDTKERLPQSLTEHSEKEEPTSLSSLGKGKTRSLDTAGSVTKGGWDADEEGPREVAFGTATLPFAEHVEHVEHEKRR